MKTARRVFIFCLTLTLLLTCVGAAHAAPEYEYFTSTRANTHFQVLMWDLDNQGGGTLSICFETVANRSMTKLGANSIVLYEKLPGETIYTAVYTYNRYTAPSILGTNKISHAFEVFYTKAVSGAQYYLSISFYAEDSTGSETLHRYSSIVTAT